MNYLSTAKALEMYGVDLHPVFVSRNMTTDTLDVVIAIRLKITSLTLFQGGNQSEYFLGLTPVGVVVYKNKTQVGKYFW